MAITTNNQTHQAPGYRNRYLYQAETGDWVIAQDLSKDQIEFRQKSNSPFPDGNISWKDVHDFVVDISIVAVWPCPVEKNTMLTYIPHRKLKYH